MLDGLDDVLEIPTELLNERECPASFSIDPLRTMYNLVMSTFPAKEVLQEEENRKV